VKGINWSTGSARTESGERREGQHRETWKSGKILYIHAVHNISAAVFQKSFLKTFFNIVLITFCIVYRRNFVAIAFIVFCAARSELSLPVTI